VAIPAGFLIGGYRVLKLIGEGGFGMVYRVERVADGKLFALKVCTASDEITLLRFSREVRAMGRIKHRNVMSVIDADLDHVPPYFIMPLALHSLRDEIPKFVTDHVAALTAFLEVCEGYSAIHAASATHRDTKPANMLRMRDETVVVSDLGLVKFDPRDTTVLTTMGWFGTEAYMAPEQRLPGGTRDAEPTVDVYSLGATLYEMVTGKYPPVFETDTLHPMLAKIIKRATANVPYERYRTVGQLAEAVSRFLDVLRAPKDPVGVFGDLLERVTEQLEDTDVEAGDVVPLFASLFAAVPPLSEHADVLVAEFHRIQPRLLLLAGRVAPDELAEALDAYANAMAVAVSGSRNFRLADAVAALMQTVVLAPVNARHKKLAIQASLIAAVDLHRFDAMDATGLMLTRIRADEDAIEIADLLRDEKLRVRIMLGRIPRRKLNKHIREVLEEIDAEDEARKRLRPTLAVDEPGGSHPSDSSGAGDSGGAGDAL